VILGGASLKGGKGSSLGALIGVVFIALINNLMIIAKISSYWQSIVIGMVLVIAVAMDYFFEKK
jgi:ribose transport system permease protein